MYNIFAYFSIEVFNVMLCYYSCRVYGGTVEVISIIVRRKATKINTSYITFIVCTKQ